MLPRKRTSLLIFAAILLLVEDTTQYSSGAPPKACIDQLPRHSSILPQSSTPPYMLTTSSSQVRQGGTVEVSITSPGGVATPIGGFVLQARSVQKPDTIVGEFTEVPDPSLEQIITCGSANDTVTHTSPQEKPALTFVWRAPDDFLGGVGFKATVAQSYSTFWRNVESPIVEVVTRDTVITTTSPSPVKKISIAPPVIMETKPRQDSAQFDEIYRGCADTKLCFGSPANCVNNGDCTAIVTVLVEGNTYTFEMQGANNPTYVASGLSLDDKMGEDSAMECARNDNGRIGLYTSWTYPKSDPYVSRTDSPQDIVQLVESSNVDGKLYCKFRRDAMSTVQGREYNLATDRFYLLIVSGDSMRDTNTVGFHNQVYESTGSALLLSETGNAAGASKLLVKLHGSFMVAAWLGTAAIGMVVARYFRQTWVGTQIGGKDVWFAWHRILMVLTVLFTITGFILILVEVGGWSSTGDNPHAITGLVTIILAFLQPIGAFFRPHPGTKMRPIFNWLHWLGGNGAHILAVTTIFLAVYLQKAELPSLSVYILAAYVVFHVIMHLVLSLAICLSDGRISTSRVNTFPMKDMMNHRPVTEVDSSGDAPYTSFRKLMLSIYSPIIALFTIAMICLVALAPLQVTN